MNRKMKGRKKGSIFSELRALNRAEMEKKQNRVIFTIEKDDAVKLNEFEVCESLVAGKCITPLQLLG